MTYNELNKLTEFLMKHYGETFYVDVYRVPESDKIELRLITAGNVDELQYHKVLLSIEANDVW